MEIAIPLLALGGVYIISNQSSEDKKKNIRKNLENFENLNRIKSNLMPNTDIPPQNFPATNINELVDDVRHFPNPNASTDKYFNQNLYEENVRNNIPVNKNIQQIYSLSGDYLDSAQFKHNNMKPFYGGKIKGNTYDINITESLLDNMNGTGSQTIKKIEQAPLFKPEKNVQWTYGMPNQSDFIQSRVNPSMKNNIVKPFDTVMVGPGLNQGFSLNGSGGYNSGMEAREKWLPKTIDELRVDTNPRLEYELKEHEGPANSYIKNAPSTEMLGRIEKQRPDTFYINTQDRWFTTTGATKGETLRPIQELGIIKNGTPINTYRGPATSTNVKVGYAPENFEQSRKVQLPCMDVNHARAIGKGPIVDGDNNLKSHTNYNNNRTTTVQPDTFRSSFSSVVGAVIAPIMDILKPTRKEETLNNAHIYGVTNTNGKNSYVNNPADVPVTTIKETTMFSPHFNINNQKDSLYVNNYTSPDNTQRDTSSAEYFSTPGGYSSAYGDMDYAYAYRQHNNDIKTQTIYNRTNQGNMNLFNSDININCSKSDCNTFDFRVNPAISVTPLPPSTKTYGAIKYPQQYNENFNNERMEPSILDAFKNNPYTQSLTTAV